jgi:hypothetical protein
MAAYITSSLAITQHSTLNTTNTQAYFGLLFVWLMVHETIRGPTTSVLSITLTIMLRTSSACAFIAFVRFCVEDS